ncbi:MAG TPA: 50S ribosomal protein L4 [Candidatus Nanoarchaeia archaeon]|nr:50S ribosomal protein L4 [Candidatus Nanoarchaeia archaeon]
MKADILDLSGIKVGTLELPPQFEEPIRLDLIKKAVLVVQNNNRQPYGAYPEAGKRQSVRISKRRRDYKTSYGHGISRTPRKVIWHRGRQFGWVGAFVPNTRGGRRAHPPKAEKEFSQDLNINERRKAIRSAISASLNKSLLQENNYTPKAPLIITEDLEKLNKTKEIKSLLMKLGLTLELSNTLKRKTKTGSPRLRGRKYRIKKGPLVVVSQKCSLMNAASNIPGLNISIVHNLNAELLAPGANPGRLIIWSNKSIERLGKEKLFMNYRRKAKLAKENGSI